MPLSLGPVSHEEPFDFQVALLVRFLQGSPAFLGAGMGIRAPGEKQSYHIPFTGREESTAEDAEGAENGDERVGI